jgi:GNAT superfamily N-acetyltransferase
MSKSKARTTTSAKRENRPPPDMPWIWLTREMLEAPAWRAMPIHARRVVERVCIEHMAHAGTANGNLTVTYRDYRAYGIGQRRIRKAIEIAEALGWIEVTVRGRRSFEAERYPSRYALTWLPQPALGRHATNRWRQITTPESARAVLRQAIERCRPQGKRPLRIPRRQPALRVVG